MFWAIKFFGSGWLAALIIALPYRWFPSLAEAEFLGYLLAIPFMFAWAFFYHLLDKFLPEDEEGQNK